MPGKPRTTNVSVIKNLWDALKPPPGPTYGVHQSTIKCAATLSVKKDSEPLYHDITTKWATWASGAHVDFSTGVGVGFGAGVPVNYTKTPTGYSFKGHLPVCTATSVCSNGQKKVWQVDIEGVVNTSVEPDEMSYSYSVDVFCGKVLSCTENGTFSGIRKSGTPNGLDGSFYGTQEWTRRCCPARQKMT